MSTFPVYDSPPAQVGPGTITNVGPSTVYYRDEAPVSSTLNDGSLAAGANTTLDGSAWLVTARGARSTVTFTPTAPSTGGGGGGDTHPFPISYTTGLQTALDDQTTERLALGNLFQDLLTDESDERVALDTRVTTLESASGGSVTKRVTQPISGTGITSLTGADIGNDWVQRVLYAPPVTPTRYRFRAANYGAFGPNAGSGSVDGLGFWIGPPSLTGTGRWAGVGASAPTRVVASGFTIPNTIDTPYISDWIVNDGLLEKGAPSVIGFAVSVPSGVTFRYDSSADLSWFGAGVGAQAGNAAAPTGGNGPYPNRALYVSIEYEFETAENGVPVVLCVGDSITQGSTGGDGGAMPHEAWPGAAALRNGFADVNAGVAGVTAASFASDLRFNRLDLATTVPDAAIVTVGTNDIIASSTDSDIITSIASIVTQLRALGIEEIYLGTVIPGGFTSGKETARVALNNRIRSLPFGVTGCIDFDKALALQATPSATDPDFLVDGATNPHPLRGGYQAMAAIVPGFGRSAT